MKGIKPGQKTRNPGDDILAEPDKHGAIAISHDAHQKLSEIRKRKDLTPEEKSKLNGEVIFPFVIDTNDPVIQTGLILKALSNGLNNNFTLSTSEIGDTIQKIFPSITNDIIEQVLDKLYKTSCISMSSGNGEPVRWKLALQLGYTSF